MKLLRPARSLAPRLTSALLGLGLLAGAAGCPNEGRNAAKKANLAGTKASAAKQFDEAIVNYKKATDSDRTYHPAWWGLGTAQYQRGEFGEAADAFGKAVELAPEQAMYQMMLGIALYEKAVKQAKTEQALKAGKPADDYRPDLSAVNFEKPLQALQEALKLNGELWRAHYYTGRIFRATDKSREAADEFTKAISGNPREWAPYVALAELYRHWDYTDEAIQVAQQGTVNVPGANEVSDIWYVLGMGYDDKRLDDKAIEAFGKALDSKPDNHKAQFQRGQAYFRKGDFAKAKSDLQTFSKSGGTSLEFDKVQANKMLMDMAAKSATPSDAGGTKQVPGMPARPGKPG